MTTPDSADSRSRGVTFTQLGVATVCLLVLGFLTSVILRRGERWEYPGRMADQLNNARQIYLAMRNYAADGKNNGAFPAYADLKDPRTLSKNSNEAFKILIPNHLSDSIVFFNKRSAWCTVRPAPMPDPMRFDLPGDVRRGANDWCYVRGLSPDSPARWPLLANAFAPGTTRYVKDQSKPGGVWKGEKAIVALVGGSVEIIDTKPDGETFYIPHPDKPTANAFEKNDDWLSGEKVDVLFPESK